MNRPTTAPGVRITAAPTGGIVAVIEATQRVSGPQKGADIVAEARYRV